MAVHSPPPRTRSARLTLVSLLVIPLLSLAALWGFVASITLGNVIRDQHYNTVVNTIAPSVTGLEQTLEAERALTLAWLGTDRRSSLLRAQLLAARRGTDRFVPAVRVAVTSVRGLLNATAQAQLDAFLTDLAALNQIRAAADSGADTQVTAFSAYSVITSAEFGYFHNSTPPGDPDLSLMTQASIASARAQDFTGGAVALIAGALAGRGVMTQPGRALFAEVVGQQNLEVSDMFSLASPVLRAVFAKVFDTPAYHRLAAIESQVASSPASRPVPVDPVAFYADAQAIQGAARATQAQSGVVLAARSAQLSDSLLTELYLAGGLGLVAVVASQFVAVRFGRRLRGELTSLYESARETASERLPRLVERLRRGEDVDVEAESPPLRADRITEIARVAQAFSAVQRTAVEAAVGQATLRKGVNQVFVSLSLRNQSLLHRQLGMLDDMERATSDPAVLADLFRLDHLTTRMRRHAEGLLVLAGATPGRGWRDPVPVADVLNAAVAEVEDYVRVDVVTDSADAVTGIAVSDIIHLLAELIENATAFSPPNTRVEVRGDAVGNGFAIEVEDRGLGMSAEEFAHINRRLASPPEFDLASTDQLGLFVAARLAGRHGIRMSLRPSPFGGTTAIVIVPRAVIVPGHEAGLALGLTGRRRSRPSPEQDWARQRPADAEAWPALPPPAPPADDPPGWEPPIPSSSGPRASEAGAVASTGRPGLPRRVRRASLAPQLRDRFSPGAAVSLREEAEPQARSPEEVSGLMAALQAGWDRGRMDDLDGTEAGSGTWPGAFGKQPT